MSDRRDEGLDELFGGGEGQPKPRTALVVVLLAVGLVLSVLGLACSSAPGGIVVLIAWVVVDKELARVEAGYLAQDYERGLKALRNAIYVSVVAVVVLFAIQFWLLQAGFYEFLWGQAILWIRDAVG